MHQGRRITDKETLDVVTMVYAGLINKKPGSQFTSLWSECHRPHRGGWQCHQIREKACKGSGFLASLEMWKASIQAYWNPLLKQNIAPCFLCHHA